MKSIFSLLESKQLKQKQFLKSALIGIAAGFINGFFGSGGGVILVTAMEKFLGVTVHKAHATAIAIILPMSVVSACIYVKSSDIKWYETLVISAGGMAGGFIGAKLLPKIPAQRLHKIFGACMVLAGVRMVF